MSINPDHDPDPNPADVHEHAMAEEETASDGEWLDCQDRSQIPYNDAVTEILIDQAVETLMWIRCPLRVGHPAPTLSALVSLAGEIENRFHDTVADARDHGYSWDDIAQRMAISPHTAKRRYAAYTHWRRKGCPWPIPT
jgi:hypothetical protein